MTASPSHRWSFDLPHTNGRISSSGLRKNNAVVPTRDGRRLYITTDDGTLSIITLKNGPNHGAMIADDEWQDETGFGGVADIIAFQPAPIEGSRIDCRSGVSLHETDGGDHFAVYAVSDVPIVQNQPMAYNDETAEMIFIASGIEEENVESRILAVNSDGSLRWEVSLSGYVEGTPLIGQADPTKVYVSLNVPDAAVDNVYDPDVYRGSVVVLNEAGAEAGGVEVTASKQSQPVPFGPLALRTMEIRGQIRDIIFATENRGSGHVLAGGIYVLSPTEEYDLRLGRGNGAYALRTLSRWLRSSIASCVINAKGGKLYAGGALSSLAAFDVGSFVTSIGEKEMIESNWETTISASIRNDTQALGAAGALSDDETSIFVAGGSTTFNSVDAMTGNVQWTDSNGESIFISEPKISRGLQSTVYAIEHASGKIIAYNTATGERRWQFDCRELSGLDSCQDSVEADFALAPNNNLLIYGDIFGRINALQIGTHTTMTAPMAVPTRDPSIPVPTISSRPMGPRPTQSPTMHTAKNPAGHEGSTSMQTQSTIQNTNTAGIAVGITLGIAASLGAVAFWFVSRRRRNGKLTGTEVADNHGAPPPFEEIKSDTCYFRRDSKGDASAARIIPGAPNSSFNSSVHKNDSDVEASIRQQGGGDRRSQVLADILQQSEAQREVTTAVASQGMPSGITDGEAIDDMIRSATSELSSKISSGLETMTKTLSETNLASLESSVMPFLSLGGGCAVDIDELSDMENAP